MNGMSIPGDTIKRWMTDRNWSESDLSRRSGVPQPTIHRIITGFSKSPRREQIEKLSRAFGRPVEDCYDTRTRGAGLTVDQRADSVYESLSFLTDDQRELVLRIVAEFVKAK
jgi:transcriptional regulator with XRE-family HTH domain